MDIVGAVSVSVLLILFASHTAATKENVDLLENMHAVEEAMDAFNRRDYVELGIKLIEIKFNINPPEQYSSEQLQLLILRRLLVKIHPYYLFWFPSKEGSRESANSFQESSSTKSNNSVKYIGQALDFLDYGTGQISEGIDILLGLGNTMIKNMMQSLEPNSYTTTEISKNAGTGEDIIGRNENEEATTKAEQNTPQGYQQKNLNGNSFGVLPNMFNVVAKAAIQTAGDAMAALLPHTGGLQTSIDFNVDNKENIGESEFGYNASDLPDIETVTTKSLKANFSNAVVDGEAKRQNINKKDKKVQQNSHSKAINNRSKISSNKQYRNKTSSSGYVNKNKSANRTNTNKSSKDNTGTTNNQNKQSSSSNGVQRTSRKTNITVRNNY